MEIGKLQVRLHDIMDGSSLARAIHVPTGPLLRQFDNKIKIQNKVPKPEQAN